MPSPPSHPNPLLIQPLSSLISLCLTPQTTSPSSLPLTLTHSLSLSHTHTHTHSAQHVLCQTAASPSPSPPPSESPSLCLSPCLPPRVVLCVCVCMQVRALVVYDEAKKEAVLEEETLIHASEEVFLAQLSRSFVCVCVCVCVCVMRRTATYIFHHHLTRRERNHSRASPAKHTEPLPLAPHRRQEREAHAVVINYFAACGSFLSCVLLSCGAAALWCCVLCPMRPRSVKLKQRADGGNGRSPAPEIVKAVIVA